MLALPAPALDKPGLVLELYRHSFLATQLKLIDVLQPVFRGASLPLDRVACLGQGLRVAGFQFAAPALMAMYGK
ncbi:MAG: hypothetical protein DWQ42_13270 [Planctomycetota bacterium]|nr:MAG: hypothetical protein DWQ42_13270 [Planctomycetota bacterium]REK40192.1 MAG: hypothetical protein DWQ46_17195 [Planctomycetota bacterium]